MTDVFELRWAAVDSLRLLFRRRRTIIRQSVQVARGKFDGQRSAGSLPAAASEHHEGAKPDGGVWHGRGCRSTVRPARPTRRLKGEICVTSGDIANRALAAVAAACVPGAKAVDLCNIGDAYINEAVSKIYNQKKEGKKLGVAFPTCVSVNNCVGHYSPLTSEDKVVLEDGDMVKIDLGVHVDGYVAVVAHTVLVGEQDVSGRKGDVLMAAWTAGEVAQRMLKDGATNNDISQAIAKVAESYQCSPVEGVLSHQMKKHVIDANKKIINKITPEQQVPKATITKNDVFAIDVVMSTGEGKPKQLEDRTTVFKRNVEVRTYSLKMKASRAFFSEVNQRFPTMPFTLRAGNEREWRMGVTECVKHDLFIEYPVLYEKKEEFVAQYKFTALLLPSNKTARITSGPAPTATSEHSVQDAELVELLAQSTEDKKKAKK
ncbi:proliferation-associated protein 2G4 [Emiliania huxleyi CCMP1516]|uniref:Peptidase M24 domain-containing protein n=2 Tax=Emiliania huxleyi TaxID=2903 RepID=A0A0D3J1L5_EMIH1|nr:proliferation-associated protein 2G4 [Emiliania huxleyi CCMP1516]EOD17400.1 proliferation-associated protein 2G4 [Emiliania huxleyi CCMP1516]|eukprot:XP_005769829.1 proliferation-associated protein 2G4 [Emiliania huxleyi CCMP1516]